MRKASVSAAKVRRMLAEDNEYQAEYDRLKPRYALIARLINARKEQIHHARGNGRPHGNEQVKYQQAGKRNL